MTHLNGVEPIIISHYKQKKKKQPWGSKGNVFPKITQLVSRTEIWTQVVWLLRLYSNTHDQLHPEHRGMHLNITSRLHQGKNGGNYQPKEVVLGQYTQQGLNKC